jgi:hypothetical protein
LGSGEVDLANLVAEPVAGQLQLVRAKGVGLEDLGTGLDVLQMDRLDQMAAGSGSGFQSTC